MAYELHLQPPAMPDAVIKMAKTMAWVETVKRLGEVGVIAVNPERIEERVDEIWDSYVPYVYDVFRTMESLNDDGATIETLLAGAKETKDRYFAAHANDFD